VRLIVAAEFLIVPGHDKSIFRPAVTSRRRRSGAKESPKNVQLEFMIGSKRMNRCVGGGADREDGTGRMWDRHSASLAMAFDRLDPLESEGAGQSRRLSAPNQTLQASILRGGATTDTLELL
jgi:hypothetical protein